MYLTCSGEMSETRKGEYVIHGCEPHYANDMHTIGRISSLDFTLHKAEKKIRSDSNFTEISPRLFSRELPFEI